MQSTWKLDPSKGQRDFRWGSTDSRLVPESVKSSAKSNSKLLPTFLYSLYTKDITFFIGLVVLGQENLFLGHSKMNEGWERSRKRKRKVHSECFIQLNAFNLKSHLLLNISTYVFLICSLFYFEQSNFFPTSGPLHRQFPLPEKLTPSLSISSSFPTSVSV